MAQHHVEDMLILTKTYPCPSRKYRETSCVAAINRAGGMCRLFPIPFRLLDGELQFKKWEWIRADVTKAGDDHRPESLRVDVNSIERTGSISPSKQWLERMHWVEPYVVDGFFALEKQRQESGKTLGFIRPTKL